MLSATVAMIYEMPKPARRPQKEDSLRWAAWAADSASTGWMAACHLRRRVAPPSQGMVAVEEVLAASQAMVLAAAVVTVPAVVLAELVGSATQPGHQSVVVVVSNRLKLSPLELSEIFEVQVTVVPPSVVEVGRIPSALSSYEEERKAGLTSPVSTAQVCCGTT